MQELPQHGLLRSAGDLRAVPDHGGDPGHGPPRRGCRYHPKARDGHRHGLASGERSPESPRRSDHTRRSPRRGRGSGIAMPTFEYEVVDRAGAIGRGRLQADDHNEAVQRFRKQGQLIVSLRATTDQASGSVADALRRSIAIATRRGVRLGTLVLFTGQLAAMLDAGIHLVRILTALGRELTDRRFARVIDDVQKSLTEGASFADALARYPRIFNTLYVAVVRAGEVSGTLPIVLDTLTVYLEKTAHLRRRVRGDRKSTRLNSSHLVISYAVFCLKKKKNKTT